MARPKILSSLTTEQTARMPEWVDQWTRLGLSTEPADWDTFEKAVRDCYRLSGFEPVPVVRVASPLAVAIAGPAATLICELIERGLWESDQEPGSAVGSAVGSGVESAVESGVWSTVWSTVWSAVWSTVESAESLSPVGVIAYRATMEIINRMWTNYLGGQFWPAWPAYMSYFREVAGLALGGNLWDRSIAYEQTCASAGWWFPTRRFVMVSDRPASISYEGSPAGNRLHNETGPAIAWRDGYALYFVHGTRVPGWIIEDPSKVTPEAIMAEPNTEIRRVMVERYGWERFATVAQLRLVDEQPDPGNPGFSLRLFDLPDRLLAGVPVRLLVCHNASPERDGRRKVYGLTVEAQHSDAVAAAASLAGVPADRYRRLARAT